MRSDKHQIFGTLGHEYWYGGGEHVTEERLDRIWDRIEAETDYRRDHVEAPLTLLERKDYR